MYVQNASSSIKFLLLLVVMVSVVLSVGCSSSSNKEKESYMSITPKEAKEIMDTSSEYIILDVRTQAEYDEGHIKNAILIPDYEISKRAENELTDKNQTILVYCRSGRRSKNAASELANMGYTQVKEFGGIIDWTYEIEK